MCAQENMQILIWFKFFDFMYQIKTDNIFIIFHRDLKRLNEEFGID
jgi:hypothetical protein